MLAYFNTPDGESPAELREVEAPSPASDEVLVEVNAFSLNRGELALLANRPQGWRPGQDITGTVVQEAEDGTGPKEGSRIVGLVEGGGWSQQVAVPTYRLAVLPDGVSFAVAATLPIAGLTALRMLRLGGPLLGRRVLVTGATGGVGGLAVQLAERAGANVAGVRVATEDAAEGPFDLILESVGGSSLTAAIGCVAPQGTIVVFGNSSGEPTPLNLYDFIGHEGARLQTFFSYRPAVLESIGEDLAVLVDQLASGVLQPELGFEGNWRELAEAVTALRERRYQGKAVLHVD